MNKVGIEYQHDETEIRLDGQHTAPRTQVFPQNGLAAAA
jgi:hypothetical protein